VEKANAAGKNRPQVIIEEKANLEEENQQQVILGVERANAEKNQLQVMQVKKVNVEENGLNLKLYHLPEDLELIKNLPFSQLIEAIHTGKEENIAPLFSKSAEFNDLRGRQAIAQWLVSKSNLSIEAMSICEKSMNQLHVTTVMNSPQTFTQECYAWLITYNVKGRIRSILTLPKM